MHDTKLARVTVGIGIFWIALGIVAFITGSSSFGVLWLGVGAVFILWGVLRRHV